MNGFKDKYGGKTVVQWLCSDNQKCECGSEMGLESINSNGCQVEGCSWGLHGPYRLAEE